MTKITKRHAISPPSSAVLDSAHHGDIEGAFGTIRQHDTTPRRSWKNRITTLLAILGPGLIVMVGDNDAGGFATYAQAGQTYGTSLLWTLMVLIPVLYVNQEMVLRLGVVTGVGHARLILERFGKFWGAFSVIDLFVLNGLTIVTEFIGISLALDYLGTSRIAGVLIAVVLTVGAASTGNFRRFERFAVALCFGSLLLVPIFVMAHPPMTTVLHDLSVPHIPAGHLSGIMLLVIGIVGTTVAPWQLFFQQSYVIDKRITPHFMRYERTDLWIGIAFVLIGGIALMAVAATAFRGQPEFGTFTDVGGVAAGLGAYVGRTAGVLFAIALIDAAILGAASIGLATSYALGDVLSIKHSLHRKPSDAKGFYAIYGALITLAAVIVLIPGAPLGLMTEGVQVLAGVLLPSATVFLLLLCNDRAVLGPWVNGWRTNLFTGAIVAILVMLSIILTASIVYPAINGAQILGILIVGSCAGMMALAVTRLWQRLGHAAAAPRVEPDPAFRLTWRMPPLSQLPRPQMTLIRRIWMGVLRAYLVIAVAMVVFALVTMSLGHR